MKNSYRQKFYPYLLDILVVVFWVIGNVLCNDYFKDDYAIIFDKQITLIAFAHWLLLFYLLFLQIRGIIKGRLFTLPDQNAQFAVPAEWKWWVYRSENPFGFWFTYILWTVLISFIIYGVWDKYVIDI